MKWDDFKTELSTMLCLARMPFWAISMKNPSMPDSFISVDSKFAALLTSYVPDVPNLVVEAQVGIFEGKASALVDVTSSTEGGWASKHNLETPSKALSLATRDAVLQVIVPLVSESQLDLHLLEHVKRSVVLPFGFSALLVRNGARNSIGIFQDANDSPLCVFSLQNFRVFESEANDIRKDTLLHFKQISTHSFDVTQLSSLSPNDWSNLFALWISNRAFRTIGPLVLNPLFYRDYCKALWAAPKRLARRFTLDYRSGLRDFGPSSQSVKARLQEIKGDFSL
jgi:hypothetical protein